MSIGHLFRASPKFVIREEDAAGKPLAGPSKEEDKARTQELARRIAELQDIFYAERQRKLLIVLQGMDTSGKDGTIRAVFGQTDPLGMRAVAFKAPSLEEAAHDFLWRVHRQVPAKGEIAIFNRSHFEDVLVPRVHGWIDKAECHRRLAHIRDFERMLAETGTVILKFFLHISRDEQRRRLQARLDEPKKHWKFDPTDLEERKHWDAYREAYAETIVATDADHAPWYVIPSDSKTQRNLAAASIVLETLEGLQLAFPAGAPGLAGIRVE